MIPMARVHLSKSAAPHRECGWCGRVLELGEGPTSHGICPSCRAEHFGDELPTCGAMHPDRPWSRCLRPSGHDGEHKTGAGWRWEGGGHDDQ